MPGAVACNTRPHKMDNLAPEFCPCIVSTVIHIGCSRFPSTFYSFSVIIYSWCYAMDMCMKHILTSNIMPYSWKNWRGIKNLAVCAYYHQIKICLLHVCTYIRMMIPYCTAKFIFANIIFISATPDQTAKFKDCQ